MYVSHIILRLSTSLVDDRERFRSLVQKPSSNCGQSVRGRPRTQGLRWCTIERCCIYSCGVENKPVDKKKSLKLQIRSLRKGGLKKTMQKRSRSRLMASSTDRIYQVKQCSFPLGSTFVLFVGTIVVWILQLRHEI